MVTRIILRVAILLSLAGPSLAQTADSAREFLDGHRTSFSTKGHPKAKGVNFTIAYPNSWAAEEGERPNIVQKFTSERGRGLEGALIITKQLPLPSGTALTTEDLKELFAPSELRGMLPPGGVFVGAQSTEIESVPAGILEYMMRGERAGITLLIHAWTLTFLYDETLVQVQFQVSGSAGSEESVSRRMDAVKPLFVLIANSIVFPEKWTSIHEISISDPAPLSSSFSLPYDDPGALGLTLVVSFIVTWGIGLAPSLLIRYVFARRPLNKRSASWIAACLSAFFWIAFLVVLTAIGERTGTGAVWVVMFFVNRWIMSRGHRPVLAATKADAHARG